MTLLEFKHQTNRLRIRFGEKHFDEEFLKLVWREVSDMSAHGYQRFCDVLIGSRTANKPPLLSEFREARLSEQKIKFQNDLRGAQNFLEREAPLEIRKHLKTILSKEFGGVESVSEALEVARTKLRIERVSK
jgi:hypothetical protein